MALALAETGAKVEVNCHVSIESADEVVRRIEDAGSQAVAMKDDVSK